MSKTMIWNYKGEADITIGERHASPIPKILTAIIILAIVVAGILVFIQRDVFYDKLNNPHIVLTQDSVTIDYQGNFNALDYIDKNKTLKYNQFMEYNSTQPVEEDDTDFPYTFTYTSNVDTSVSGDYKVVYSSSIHIQENEVILNVTVSAPPVEPFEYLLPHANKNLSFICSHVPPNIVPGFVLFTDIYIDPTG